MLLIVVVLPATTGQKYTRFSKAAALNRGIKFGSNKLRFNHRSAK